jgi:hypothetical protein
VALERAYVATPIATGRGDIIASPFQFLFTGEDNLRVLIVNSLSGVEVTLDGRFLASGDTVPSPISQSFRPTADRALNTFDVFLGTGFLLNASLVVTVGAPLIGQTYVMVQIIRGFTGAKMVLGCILGGYITAMQHLAFPGSAIESSISGGDYIRLVGGATPAAGLDFSETVPTGARWELLRVNGVLTTDATVIDRYSLLTIVKTGLGSVAQVPPVAAHPASTARASTWGVGLVPVFFAPSNVINGALPQGAIILAGDRWETTTLNLQPGDQWFGPEYLVREWLEAA